MNIFESLICIDNTYYRHIHTPTTIATSHHSQTEGGSLSVLGHRGNSYSSGTAGLWQVAIESTKTCTKTCVGFIAALQFGARGRFGRKFGIASGVNFGSLGA